MGFSLTSRWSEVDLSPMFKTLLNLTRVETPTQHCRRRFSLFFNVSFLPKEIHWAHRYDAPTLSNTNMKVKLLATIDWYNYFHGSRSSISIYKKHQCAKQVILVYSTKLFHLFFFFLGKYRLEHTFLLFFISILAVKILSQQIVTIFL